jgi:zinc/manganese transport system permease protein
MTLELDWSLLGPPLAAGFLIVVTHVAFGREVLKRGIIFIDLTIAQVAALGVIVAGALQLGDAAWGVQTLAVGAALVVAALLSWTERHWPHLQEAFIGSLYVVSASFALLLLANDPHGAEAFNKLLSGQLLWVTYEQIMPVALLYVGILIAWWLWGERMKSLFYFLFALLVTASVQLVGVFLVFATLILPALGICRINKSSALLLGYSVGAISYIAGLWLSFAFDIPAGPLVVCLLAVLSVVAFVVLAPSKAGES